MMAWDSEVPKSEGFDNDPLPTLLWRDRDPLTGTTLTSSQIFLQRVGFSAFPLFDLSRQDSQAILLLPGLIGANCSLGLGF
jgi:hypothetical protein